MRDTRHYQGLDFYALYQRLFPLYIQMARERVRYEINSLRWVRSHRHILSEDAEAKAVESLRKALRRLRNCQAGAREHERKCAERAAVLLLGVAS